MSIGEIITTANAVLNYSKSFIGVGGDKVIALAGAVEAIQSCSLCIESLISHTFIAVAPTACDGILCLWVGAQICKANAFAIAVGDDTIALGWICGVKVNALIVVEAINGKPWCFCQSPNTTDRTVDGAINITETAILEVNAQVVDEPIFVGV